MTFLNTQMIILRQFCFQLILKRPSTQLIIVFCSQSSSLLALVQFYSMVRTLFKNSKKIGVINNSFSTGYFALERGTC